MTRVALVRVDATVGTVCAAAGFLTRQSFQYVGRVRPKHVMTYGCLLNDNVFDSEVFNIDTLGISVGFSVF